MVRYELEPCSAAEEVITTLTDSQLLCYDVLIEARKRMQRVMHYVKVLRSRSLSCSKEAIAMIA